jgi:hypothetical protein
MSSSVSKIAFATISTRSSVTSRVMALDSTTSHPQAFRRIATIEKQKFARFPAASNQIRQRTEQNDVC